MVARPVAHGDLPFAEKSFYLREFRGRTLMLAACPGADVANAGVRAVLAELASNHTPVVLLSSDAQALAALAAPRLLEAGEPGLEGKLWRALQQGACAGVRVPAAGGFASVHELALRLGVTKLVWLDPRGGLVRGDGKRLSFVDLADLDALLPDPERGELLEEIEAALRAGLAGINVCAPDGLAEELFTYAGSGTLFTERGYVEVRRLTIDDFGAALALVARGEAEGFLVPRSEAERDAVLAEAFGAFVEGRHLAGIGALLRHGDVGEISSLYTLTRFLGEGIGGHLVQGLCEESARRGDRFVFACTTADRVAGFFESNGFERVDASGLPPEKWRNYDPERRKRVLCLARKAPPTS